MEYKAEDFVPVMACPSQVDKIRNVSELEGTEIDRYLSAPAPTAVRGSGSSCRGFKGQEGSRFCKTDRYTSSRKIYRQADEMGILDTLAEAGAIITHPGCGLCCGRTGGILTDGERVVATNNRNFFGPYGNFKGTDLSGFPKDCGQLCSCGQDRKSSVII